MGYVVLSIICSVMVSVLLKLARRYHIDVYQAITWNYAMAIFLTWVFLKPQISTLDGNAPLNIYVILGFLLPLLFVVIATSVRFTGIVRTDVAQRLSLFIPIIAAFLIFGEQPGTVKIIGLVIGFAAIICSIPWHKQPDGRKNPPNAWLYLLLVFFGMGIIDVLFKEVALFKQVSTGTSLFVVYTLAFVISIIGLLFQVLTKKMRFSWPHIFIGWVLGVINFGNILFYIKAHQAIAQNPSIVFSSMNIGVIVAGTIVGVFIFREKLSMTNKLGIVLAIIAIAIISHPEFFIQLFSHHA